MSSENISESTNRLREKIRSFRETERCTKRKTESDSLRLGLGEISSMISELEDITVNDISGLASRIKRRKHATCDDMLRLSQGFLQRSENITTFVKIPGALNVLVKELTGSDSKAQIMACETFCNLSLGDSVVCEKIVMAAGTYFITLLDNSDPRLQRTSLWVITNILATLGKGSDILIAQKIAPKLVNLLCHGNNSEELSGDIIIAVDILLDIDVNVMNFMQMLEIRKYLQTKKLQNGPQLKILFNTLFKTDNCTLVDSDTPKLIAHAVSTLNEVQDIRSYENICKILYSIRIMANLLVKNPICCDIIDNECFFSLSMDFWELLNKVFSWYNKSLNRELFWLIANMMSSQIFLSKRGNLLDKIKVPSNIYMC